MQITETGISNVKAQLRHVNEKYDRYSTWPSVQTGQLQHVLR